MTFATPWLGRKRVAFVPLYRSNAAPPDLIPPDWETVILRRVIYDPRREANGADRSLRAWLRAASSGLADIDPFVLPMQTIDKQVVEADELEGKLGRRLRDQGMDAAVLVMLGGRGSGTNRGFWSRVVMAESNGVWLMELIHGLTGFKDLYHFNNDVDPPERTIDTFDEMSASSQTHPTAFTKNELGWLDAAAIPLHAGASAEYELQHIGLAQPPVAGRAAAVRIGNGFPYVMVEARKKTDQFEAGMPSTGDGQERGIASEGVIAYRVQTRNPTVQEREGLQEAALSDDAEGTAARRLGAARQWRDADRHGRASRRLRHPHRRRRPASHRPHGDDRRAHRCRAALRAGAGRPRHREHRLSRHRRAHERDLARSTRPGHHRPHRQRPSSCGAGQSVHLFRSLRQSGRADLSRRRWPRAHALLDVRRGRPR